MEKSVNPIFFTLRKPDKPEQIASGVFVCIKDQYFVFSASHVFDDIGTFQLLMGVESEEKLISFAGERFSTARGCSGTHRDDKIDASVFHIQTEVPNSIKNIALNLDQLDGELSNNGDSCFIVSGIRSKKSRTIKNQSFTERECFGTLELDAEDYTRLKLDKEFHLLLAYENERYVKGEWQKSPKLAGFSGGAIFDVSGFDFGPVPVPNKQNLKSRLVAITIEQRRGRNGHSGVLIGTRVSVHLSLIQKFLPEVLLE